MCFISKKKKEKQKQEKITRLEEQAKRDIARAKKEQEEAMKAEEAKKMAAEKPVKKEEVKAEPVKKAPAKKAAPAKAVKAEVSEKKAPAKEKEVKDPENVKYHVSQNKDDKSEFFKQWRVRKEGSKKTIKYFPTQEEAIAYAKQLAKNNDTNIVIHKLDGTIRKQNY